MELNITPYQGLGEFLFSDDYKTTISKLGDIEYSESVTQFMGTEIPTIFIEEYDLLISFKDKGEGIDFFELTLPYATLNDVSILSKSFEFIEKWFSEMGYKIEKEYDGFRSDDIGIGVFASPDEESRPKNPESLIIYCKGHYDNQVDVEDFINFNLDEE